MAGNWRKRPMVQGAPLVFRRGMNLGADEFKAGDVVPLDRIAPRRVRQLYESRWIMHPEGVEMTPATAREGRNRAIAQRQAERAAQARFQEPDEAAATGSVPEPGVDNWGDLDEQPPETPAEPPPPPVLTLYQAKHRGNGRWFVMDGERTVSGPHMKADAEAEAKRLAAEGETPAADA